MGMKGMMAEIAMGVRGLAFHALAFGPALALLWIWAKDADARQRARLAGAEVVALGWVRVAGRAAAALALTAACYGIAAMAFPGPWLAD